MNEIDFPTSEHYSNEFAKDKEAVFINIKSEEQTEDGNCGPAVVTDVLKTLGKEVIQQSLTREAEARLAELNKPGIAEIGTPPEILQYLLETHGADFVIKDSVDEITEESREQAKAYLDEKLKEGCVVICSVQTIPNYKEERDIEADGHYVIVCGKTMINGKSNYIVVDPMFHYYQRLSNENSLYTVHMGEDAPEGTSKTELEIEYNIPDANDPEAEVPNTETRDVVYTEEQLESFGIYPKMYGVRFVSADRFVENWKDVSSFGEEYNQYGIAVKITQRKAPIGYVEEI